MLVNICYGEDKLELNLPDSATCDYFECKADSREIDDHAFTGRLAVAEQELFHTAQADLFVINDAYRPTPTYEILNRLQRSARISKKAKFLIATGCHQAPDKNQLKSIFCDLYAKLQNRILIHDAHDMKMMTLVGEDISGDPVYINRHFLAAEHVVTIGSVEPHYFAGFTGGRKAIFPGLCDFETTARNHRLAVSFDASPVKLSGNPVDQHLQSLMKMIPDKKMLSIQIVSGPDGKIQTIFCGNIESSFRRACELSHKIYSFNTKRRYNMIFAEVLPPLDSNLYQLQKSLENTQPAVIDGGSIILFSPCREGIGSDYFYGLADRWKEADKSTGRSGSDFGIHKLARVAQIVQRINIHLYSELEDGVSDKVFFKTTKNPQKIIDNLINNNRDIRVALVHDAGHTVLRVH